MSRALARQAREPFDDYPTPAWCVRRLLERWLHDDTYRIPQRGYQRMAWGKPVRVLECCAGAGSIASVVRELWPAAHITAIEVQDRYKTSLKSVCDEVYCPQDVLEMELESLPVFDLTITNPPFSLAEEVLRKVLPVSNEIAFLLRLGFASSRRSQLFDVVRPDIYVAGNRPSFKPLVSQTDNDEYAWFTKHKDDIGQWGNVRWLAPTPLSERKADHNRIWSEEQVEGARRQEKQKRKRRQAAAKVEV